MPPVSVEYLTVYLWEIGPTLAAGMGAGPITHGEIESWQSLTGIELQPWEVRYLRRMSFEYLNQSHQAEKRDCPAPWVAMSDRDRAFISDKVKNVMRSFKKGTA